MPTQRVSVSDIVDEAFPQLGLSWGPGETRNEMILRSTECKGQAAGSGAGFTLGLAYFITAHAPAPHPPPLSHASVMRVYMTQHTGLYIYLQPRHLRFLCKRGGPSPDESN